MRSVPCKHRRGVAQPGSTIASSWSCGRRGHPKKRKPLERGRRRRHSSLVTMSVVALRCSLTACARVMRRWGVRVVRKHMCCSDAVRRVASSTVRLGPEPERPANVLASSRFRARFHLFGLFARSLAPAAVQRCVECSGGAGWQGLAIGSAQAMDLVRHMESAESGAGQRAGA